MRILIISDIHANMEALKKTLSYIEDKNIDKIISLGDLCGIGADPKECIDEIIKLDKEGRLMLSLYGNHEGYQENGFPKYVHDDKRETSKVEQDHQAWQRSMLLDEEMNYIMSLKKEEYMTIEGKKIYLSHYPLNKDGSFGKHIKSGTLEENIDLFKDIDSDIFIYGHTHIPCNYTHDNKMYINPGSVGASKIDRYIHFGILEITNDKANYEEVKLDYDYDGYKEHMREVNYPMVNEILKIFYNK